jgi:hypothetical protein
MEREAVENKRMNVEEGVSDFAKILSRKMEMRGLGEGN